MARYSSFKKYTTFLENKFESYDSAESFYRENQSEIDDLVSSFFSDLSKNGHANSIELIQIFFNLMIKDNNLKYFTLVLKAAEYAIDMVEIYHDMLPPDIQMGYRLHLFFYAIEALKLGQTLGAYDKTPSGWREGLMHSNSTQARLDISTAIEIFVDNLPDDLKHLFNRQGFMFGNHLGSGQYVEVYELYMPNDIRSQLNIPHKTDLTAHIQNQNAPELVGMALDYVIRVLELRGDSKIGPVEPSGLIPLMLALKASMPDETNFTRSENKNKISAEQSEEVSLTIQNIFGVAKEIKEAKVTFDFGTSYYATKSMRITKMMHGDSLDTLGKLRGISLLTRICICVSMWMNIFSRIVAGKHLNHDMHPRNFKYLFEVRGTTLHICIGLYDELALCKPGNNKDRETFANMLMDGIGGALINGIHPDSALAIAYFDLCKQATQPGSKLDPDSGLFSMLKAMITSTHYQLVIDNYSKNLKIIATIYLSMIRGIGQSGISHKVISETLATRFKSISLMRSKSKKNLSSEDQGLIEAELERKKYLYPKKIGGLKEALSSVVIKTLVLFVFDKLEDQLYSQDPSPFKLEYKPKD